MKNSLLVVLLIYGLNSKAQTTDTVAQGDIAFTQVESFPVYAGCENEEKINRQECFDKKVMEAVSENFIYPASAKQHGVEGEVVVSFIIEKDGSIGEVKLFKGLSNKYEEAEKIAAAREIEKSALLSVENLEIINPATKAGKPVRMKYTIPIQVALK